MSNCFLVCLVVPTYVWFGSGIIQKTFAAWGYSFAVIFFVLICCSIFFLFMSLALWNRFKVFRCLSICWYYIILYTIRSYVSRSVWFLRAIRVCGFFSYCSMSESTLGPWFCLEARHGTVFLSGASWLADCICVVADLTMLLGSIKVERGLDHWSTAIYLHLGER